MQAHLNESREQASRFWRARFDILLVASATGIVALPLIEQVTALLGLGPLSHHMTQHILLMNIAAPLMAWGLTTLRSHTAVYRNAHSKFLVAASILQIALLWAWHAPAALSVANSLTDVTLTMHLSLFLAALWFWYAVLSIGGAKRWQSIVSLLLTGKLFCLLAAILVFAPRPLYVLGHHAAHHPSVTTTLEDQQLAGLLMIVVCPATYVLAGVILAARWLHELEQNDGARSASSAPVH
jgi:putative membrane protein